MMVENKSWGKK